MDTERLVRKHRKNLVPVAEGVAASTEFTLSLPCALLSGDEAVATCLAGLGHHLPSSVALASEAIQRFVLLRAEHGFDRAFELCSSDDDEGEAFVREWDAAVNDLAKGVVVTLNDLVAMVEQAKKGWGETDRRMLVVAHEGDKVCSGLVAVDWVAGYE